MASRFLTPLGSRGLFGRDPFLDMQREMNRLLDRGFRDLAGTGEDSFMLAERQWALYGLITVVIGVLLFRWGSRRS